MADAKGGVLTSYDAGFPPAVYPEHDGRKSGASWKKATILRFAVALCAQHSVACAVARTATAWVSIRDTKGRTQVSGFLYYIEGARSDAKIADLRKLGLGYAFNDDGDFTASGVTRGPGDSGPGIIVADTSRLGERALGFYPEEQTWGAKSESVVQIGYYTGCLPTPEDLARSHLLDGHFVKLGDGKQWLIPIARGVGEKDGEVYWYEALPKGMTLNGGHRWVQRDVVPEYAELWKIAQLWAAGIFNVTVPDGKGDDVVKVNVDFNENIGTAACIVLSANYRVDDNEIALLNLFSDERLMYEILNATVDMPRWEALLQKQMSRALASGSNIADGPQDAIEVGGQRQET